MSEPTPEAKEEAEIFGGNLFYYIGYAISAVAIGLYTVTQAAGIDPSWVAAINGVLGVTGGFLIGKYGCIAGQKEMDVD